MTASWAAELPASALACTGLRIYEALALTCGDVDLSDSMLTVLAGNAADPADAAAPQGLLSGMWEAYQVASFEATSISVWFGDRKVFERVSLLCRRVSDRVYRAFGVRQIDLPADSRLTDRPGWRWIG